MKFVLPACFISLCAYAYLVNLTPSSQLVTFVKPCVVGRFYTWTERGTMWWNSRSTVQRPCSTTLGAMVRHQRTISLPCLKIQLHVHIHYCFSFKLSLNNHLFPAFRISRHPLEIRNAHDFLS